MSARAEPTKPSSSRAIHTSAGEEDASSKATHPRRLGLLVLALAVVIGAGSLTPVGTAVAKEITDVLVTNTAPIAVDDAGVPVQGVHFMDQGCETLYTVPAGWRLTVEYISARATALEGNVAQLEVHALDENGFWVASAYVPFGAANAASEMVQLFVTESLLACADVLSPDPSADGHFQISWSGHIRVIPPQRL